MPKGVYDRKVSKTRNLKYGVGTQHNVDGQGIIEVLEYIPKDIKAGVSNTRAVVKFIATGYVCNVQLSNIPAGKIKDRRKATVYGVGYLDTDITIPTRGSGSTIRRAYDLWCNMIKRTEVEVGYEDVTVDKRWYSFKNFLNSLPELPGYDLWESTKDFHLDKDMLLEGSREYSKNSCSFVKASANLSDAANRRWGNK